jgi:hypothetical protein
VPAFARWSQEALALRMVWGGREWDADPAGRGGVHGVPKLSSQGASPGKHTPGALGSAGWLPEGSPGSDHPCMGGPGLPFVWVRGRRWCRMWMRADKVQCNTCLNCPMRASAPRNAPRALRSATHAKKVLAAPVGRDQRRGRRARLPFGGVWGASRVKAAVPRGCVLCLNRPLRGPLPPGTPSGRWGTLAIGTTLTAPSDLLRNYPTKLHSHTYFGVEGNGGWAGCDARRGPPCMACLNCPMKGDSPVSMSWSS